MSDVTTTASRAHSDDLCRILSLDGGGAKGFYTLGVLREIEFITGRPLCESFDLVFGTSTGAIIAALIALGFRIEEIHELYRKYVPEIMQRWGMVAKSDALARLGKQVFGDRRFDAFKTGIGIVATRWENERPMIFKAASAQAHGRSSSFVPGFGCSIDDAVQASCSAYPFFQRKIVVTSVGDHVELIDGGYCANNPTLYAIADAVAALKKDRSQLRVVSVGVGNYPEPKAALHMKFIKRLVSVQLLQKTLEFNTQSMDQLREVLFSDIATVRISDSFTKPEMATDMFEGDFKKLNLLRQRGADSFAGREVMLRRYLL